MLNYTQKYVTARLQESDTAFGEKLRLVGTVLPQLDLLSGVRIVELLLDSALKDRPSYEELDALCEVSDSSEVLHDYLRGFFVSPSMDPRRLELAQRLEGVISYRLARRHALKSSHKLRQTIAEYLLRARN